MKLRDPLVLTLAIVLSACGTTTSAARPATSVHRREAYRLYTHCGIHWAKIDGRFWRATRPSSDGSGNPPQGWNNPFEEGTLTFTNPSTAEFSSPAGDVTFQRTNRTQPPLACS
jgi:hypothetical protein